jgi:flagellar hook-basal body complex protein FliE
MRIPTNPAINQLLGSRGLQAPNAPRVTEPGIQAEGGDFGSMLMDVLKEVNEAQNKSKELQEDLITGRRSVDIHEVMISVEKASTAMQLTMAVRNKLLESYQEISRMQV